MHWRKSAGQSASVIDELGCWIIANAVVGQLPQHPIFWHLDTYPTHAGAEAAKGPRGTVVESLGKVWLFTIEVAGWHPSGGAHVAEIGPLPVSVDAKYSAQYMEAVFTPGMTAPAHRHSGPEAWYTLTGETCLETPEGKMVGRAGGPPVIRHIRNCLKADPAYGKGIADALGIALSDVPAWAKFGISRKSGYALMHRYEGVVLRCEAPGTMKPVRRATVSCYPAWRQV